MPRSAASPHQIRGTAIDITLAHIRRHGFEKVRLSEVARDMGLSHAALYSHFVDKAALLDAVSERWLVETRAALDLAGATQQDPRAKIEDWFIALYRLKRERVLRDSELYRAFDAAATLRKPFVTDHFAAMQQQLRSLIGAVTANPDDDAVLLFDATAAFHHPKLVMELAHEDREPLLRQLVRTLLIGLEARRDQAKLRPMNQ